jgi:hypothetical protein
MGAPQITVSGVGNTTSSVATLLVRLEIIATTYCSMISKTQVFSVNSHYIYSDPSTDGISGLTAGGA